jgi:hypothetical protein
MEKNKTLFVRRLCCILIFSLFGLFVLNAEEDDDLDGIRAESADPKKEYGEKFAGIEGNVNRLLGSVTETQKFLKDLSSNVSKLQVWQFIHAISAVFITLFLAGLVLLLLLKQLKLHVVIDDGHKALSEEKLSKEHFLAEEPRNTSPGISPVEFNMLKNKLDNMQFQLRQLTDKMDSQAGDTSRLKGDLTSFQSTMEDFRQRIKDTDAAFSLLRTDIDKNREKLAKKELVESNPVAAFNQWAQNPHLPLPPYFTYVTNVKPEFRTKQAFTDTSTETEWIRNTAGEKKYLFPNPNKIDNISGPIDKLYKVTGIRKAKGSNSIKVTEACQIIEGNFIEYQGELILF